MRQADAAPHGQPRFTRGGESEHPEPDLLESFHWGDLDEVAADSVRVHLALCAPCREQVLLLDAMGAAPPTSAVEVPAGEGERALARLRAQVAPRPFPRWSAARGPYAIAASLLVAVVALLLGPTAKSVRDEKRLRQTEAELDVASVRLRQLELKLRTAGGPTTVSPEGGAARMVPEANTPILELRIDRTRGGGESAVAELPRGGSARLVTLVLEDPGESGAGAHRAQIVDSSGRTLFTVAGLRATSYGSFVLTCERVSLPLGPGWVRLEAERGGSWTEIARYAIRRQE